MPIIKRWDDDFRAAYGWHLSLRLKQPGQRFGVIFFRTHPTQSWWQMQMFVGLFAIPETQPE